MGHCLQFLVILLMETFCMTEGTFVQKLYKKLEPGHNIAGLVIAGQKAVSPIQCSRICRGHNRCAVYQYKGTGPENCLLIHKNCSDANGHIFEDDDNGETYQKVVKPPWSGLKEPFCWTGPKIALYESFDASTALVLMEGTKQMDSIPMVSGKVNFALTLDHTRRQWIDLGIHTEVCITHPETCTVGGAISLWVNIAEGLKSVYGIVSSRSHHTKKTAMEIYGYGDYIYFLVYPLNKQFIITSLIPTGWTHIVFNYIGPDHGQGIRVYGMEVVSDATGDAARSAGDGRIVVGRRWTEQDRDYASMQIDELIFFNKALSTTDIELLSNAV